MVVSRTNRNMRRPVETPCGNRAAFPAILLMLVALLAMPVGRTVPLEVYGRLPTLEEVALSPNGSRLAFVRTTQNTRNLLVASLAGHEVLGGLRLGDSKLRGIEWADDDHLMIITSATSMPFGLIGPQHEWYMLQVYDVVKRRSQAVPDPDRVRGVTMMNVISGEIMVRRLEGHTVLFVPGIYVTERTLPALFRIDLQTGGQRLYREGSSSTEEWLVDDAGEVAAEEDYDEHDQRWRLLKRSDGRLQEIASGHEAIEFPRLLGFGPEAGTLLMQTIEDGDPVWRLLSLKDGTFGPPMAERHLMSSPIEDRLTYRMIGGVHVDDSTHYVFFDPATQRHWDAIVRAFPDERIRFVSASSDFKKIVVRVDGAAHGFLYELIDMETHRAQPIGDIYEGVTEPLEVRRITYAAADGLRIPAYLTLPRGKPPKNLPLILLPHGGPAVRETADFDWWAQAVADQGYAVLQPNFRGSDLSLRYLQAGFGEWGRKMQTDLSDGVRYLAKEGIIDPARVCIVGGSYGGYAALAGVTLDPGIYRCAVSVAGISDLKRMLQWVNENHTHRTQRYWDRFMGVSGPGDPVLDAISPIKHLDAINVPVLLIHGRDDTVVPFEQSSVMFDALRRTRKDVEMVTLKNEDHWLSRSETRLQMLQSLVTFLRAHNPPD
jgi:cephalosporin-C deacetylase-like acetyl esterase